MTALRPRALVLAGVLGAVLALAARALTPAALALPWFTLVALVLLAAAVLLLARRVRRYVRDPKGHRIDPLVAARTAVMAQATALLGALLAGWGLGLLARELALLQYRGLSGSFVLACANLVLGIVVGASGWVAEQWCKRPPEDPDDDDFGTPERRGRTLAEGDGGYARGRADGAGS